MYSELIYDEIRAWTPPGRFLKQDPNTRLWSDIGKKKALGKIRQALREGAPELLKVLEAGGGYHDDLSTSDISSIDQDNSIQVPEHAVSEPPKAPITKSTSRRAPTQRAPSLKASRKEYMRFMSDVSLESSGSDSLLTLPIIPVVELNENRKRPAPSAHVPKQVNVSSSTRDNREPIQGQGTQGQTMQQISNTTGEPDTVQAQAPDALSQLQNAYSQALQTDNRAGHQNTGGSAETNRTPSTSITNPELSKNTGTAAPANGIDALITALCNNAATISSLATSSRSMTSESDDTTKKTTSSFSANPPLFKTGISAPGHDINAFLAALSSNVAIASTETPQAASVRQITNPRVTGMDTLSATYCSNAAAGSTTTSYAATSSSSSSNTEQLPQQLVPQRAQQSNLSQPRSNAGSLNLTDLSLENSAAGNTHGINNAAMWQSQLLQYQLALQHLQAQMVNSLSGPGSSHLSANSQQQTGELASSLADNLNPYQQLQLQQTMNLYQQIQGQSQQPSNLSNMSDHDDSSDLAEPSKRAK